MERNELKSNKLGKYRKTNKPENSPIKQVVFSCFVSPPPILRVSLKHLIFGRSNGFKSLHGYSDPGDKVVQPCPGHVGWGHWRWGDTSLPLN